MFIKETTLPNESKNSDCIFTFRNCTNKAIAYLNIEKSYNSQDDSKANRQNFNLSMPKEKVGYTLNYTNKRYMDRSYFGNLIYTQPLHTVTHSHQWGYPNNDNGKHNVQS